MQHILYFCSEKASMKQVRPKKNLGQHFLTDLTIAKRIADTVDEPYSDLPVLEVGPGMGVMTQFLVKKPRPLKVVEIDRESVAYLKGTLFREYENASEENTSRTPASPHPHTQIFFKMLDNRDLIPCCTGMIQHEVAVRMASKPGNKQYGILSVLIQAWYNVEYLFTVEPSVFNPPPKVQSAVIRMTRNDVQHLGCDEQLFKRVVKTVFNQRRKMLRVSLKQLFGRGYEAAEGQRSELFQHPFMTLRPEQLSISQFVELTNLVEKELFTNTNSVCADTNP